MNANAGAVQHSIAARLERLPTSRWHVTACFLMGFATFADGFEVLSTAYIIPVLREAWHLNPHQIGFLISIGFAGQAVSSVAAGWIAERFGRLKTIMGSVALFSVTSIVCAFSWDWNSLALCKFVQGLGIGALLPVATAYMSEIVQARKRGRFYVVYGLSYTVGLTSAGLAGAWIVPHLGWQAMFYLGGVPLLVVPAMIELLPESPRWLVAKGRPRDAERAVERIEAAVLREGRALPPVSLADFDRVAAADARSDWRELFHGIYFGRTMTLWLLSFAIFAIITPMTTWLPTIYRSNFHVSIAEANLFGAVHQFCGICGGLTCSLFIDWVGRRRWFIFGFFGSATVLVLYWLIGSPSIWALALVTCANQYCMGSLANSLSIYTAELYPTRIRATGTSLSGVWSRVSSGVGPVALGFLLPAYGVADAFIVIAAMSLVMGLTVIAIAPETKGRILEALSP